MIKQNLVKKTTIKNNENVQDNASLIIKYINDKRKGNGIKPLIINSKLNEIAVLKSQEMIKKDYFSHTSPSYGTPFKMMKNFGITYKTAGENIAGNTTMKKAVDSWMASETHKKNILSNAYNYIGAGATISDKYGYIIDVMFIGK
ncbi:MAG: CAP domain-containing protein [Clostridia bacterium]